MRPKAWLEVGKQTVKEFVDDEAELLAGALAFYTVVSLAPLLVLVVALAGTIFGREAVQAELVEQAHAFVGATAAQSIASVLDNAQRPRLESFQAIVGIAVLVWGATRVFTQLQRALNKVWDVQVVPAKKLHRTVKALVRKRILSFAMVLTIAFLLLVSLVISAAISIAVSYLGDRLPASAVVYQAVNASVSFAIIAMLFAAMYRVLPDAHVAWRDALVGGIATAVLFVLGKLGISTYLGAQDVGSAYGAAGSVVVLLVWVYYSAMIFLLGAELTEVFAKKRGRGIDPEPHAARMHEKLGRAA